MKNVNLDNGAKNPQERKSLTSPAKKNVKTTVNYETNKQLFI